VPFVPFVLFVFSCLSWISEEHHHQTVLQIIRCRASLYAGTTKEIISKRQYIQLVVSAPAGAVLIIHRAIAGIYR